MSLSWSYRVACVGVFALLGACGGGEKKPETPEGEMVSLAWELMAPLDSSLECKKIGDALAPWIASKGPRFVELVQQVKKVTGADANNLDRVEMKLKSVATRCVNPEGMRTKFTEHDERVEQVVKMFPKMQMGFELR